MHTKCTLHENEVNEQNEMNERQRKRTWSNAATNRQDNQVHDMQCKNDDDDDEERTKKNYILKSCNSRNEPRERCCRSEQENMLKRTSGVTLWRWEGGPQYNTSHIIGRCGSFSLLSLSRCCCCNVSAFNSTISLRMRTVWLLQNKQIEWEIEKIVSSQQWAHVLTHLHFTHNIIVRFSIFLHLASAH